MNVSSVQVKYIKPEGRFTPPGYSEAVSVEGPHRTVYIGGQNATADDGSIVGVGDLAAQTEQALRNMDAVMKAAGGTLDDIVKWTVYLVQGQDPQVGFAAYQRAVGQLKHAPAVTVVFVAGLGRPEWLVEIEAIAVVPQ